jgi:S-adenosyl-l-methionine hydroxide adenosyltransferase
MSDQIYVTIIADYGNGDPAFREVSQRLLLHLPNAQVDTLSVPPFDTLAIGFWNAQLALNPGPNNRLIYHNCAPRKDNLKARPNNEGEKLTYAQLPNKVKVIGVFAGHALSFLKNHAEILKTINVPASGSQFRSRDIFPEAVALLAQNDFSLLGEDIALEEIPDVPNDRIAWVDGYGNIKTTISSDSVNLTPGTKISLKIGLYIDEATYVDGSFTVPERGLAFAPGSSGWTTSDGKRQFRWMELFLRGGSAWERFGKPKLDERIKMGRVRSQELDDLPRLEIVV